MLNMSIIMILVVVVGLIVHCFVAFEFYKAAVMKGWSQKKYFFMAFFLWVIGYLLIIALPDRGGNARKAIESDDLPEL